MSVHVDGLENNIHDEGLSLNVLSTHPGQAWSFWSWGGSDCFPKDENEEGYPPSQSTWEFGGVIWIVALDATEIW